MAKAKAKAKRTYKGKRFGGLFTVSEGEAMTIIIGKITTDRQAWNWMSTWDLTFLSSSRRKRDLFGKCMSFWSHKASSEEPPQTYCASQFFCSVSDWEPSVQIFLSTLLKFSTICWSLLVSSCGFLWRFPFVVWLHSKIIAETKL